MTDGWYPLTRRLTRTDADSATSPLRSITASIIAVGARHNSDIKSVSDDCDESVLLDFDAPPLPLPLPPPLPAVAAAALPPSVSFVGGTSRSAPAPAPKSESTGLCVGGGLSGWSGSSVGPSPSTSRKAAKRASICSRSICSSDFTVPSAATAETAIFEAGSNRSAAADGADGADGAGAVVTAGAAVGDAVLP